MKKFKYFLWTNPDIGYGKGKTKVYINANSKEEAKEKLKSQLGFKHDPHFINGDVEEVVNFVQPKPIPVIK